MVDIKIDESKLYSSSDYRYNFELIIQTTIRAKTENSQGFVARQVSIKPDEITVYDRREFMQIDLMFQNSGNGNAEYNAFVGSLNDSEFRAKYNNHYILTNVRIVPNTMYPESYLYMPYLECPVSVGNAPLGYIAASFCAPIKTSYTHLDNGEKKSYDNLKKIVEYNIVTDEEFYFLQNKISLHDNESFVANKKKSKNLFSGMFSSKNNKTPEESLIESLNMSEQEKQIFDPDMLNLSVGSLTPEKELEELIGLDDVKTEILKLKSKLKYKKRQKERNIFVKEGASMHMCFTGSPGTGKTTVARIITGILYNMGYVKENKCVEINGQNLKGGYTGQTAIITKLVMKSAKNKVLFIDEAYALFDDYENGFGKEAVAVILKEMEDERDNTIVIFAGYKNDMEQFLLMNDGLKSRINRYIHFRNYTSQELTEILLSLLRKKKLYITTDALAKCFLAFKKAEMSERFSNGRFVRNMVEKIEYEHAYNTHNIKDTTRQDTITVEDVSDELIQELLTRSM